VKDIVKQENLILWLTFNPCLALTGFWKTQPSYLTISDTCVEISTNVRGPFLEGPEKFSHPKSRSKISNLFTTELFYSYILNTNRGSLHTRSFRCIHLSVFKYWLTKNGFSGPKRFRGFRETGPCRSRRDIYCTAYQNTSSLIKSHFLDDDFWFQSEQLNFSPD